MTKDELLDVCFDADKRILKQFGYFYNAHMREGKMPEDLVDVDIEAVKEIASFLEKHPICPRRKRRKRINYCDTYYLGYSYGLKHVIERFLPSHYCANGDFIAACIEVGFKVVPEPESPNANIYIPIEKARRNETLNYYIVV